MVRKIFFLAATTAVVSANAQNLEIDGHEAVDLGLSVLWATCNVGANSPEEIGDYFAWGETEPKDVFSESNYLFKKKSEELDAEHDAATQKWGENWRMPTKNEIDELISLTPRKENNGYYLSGNGNSIFVPASGYKNNSVESYNIGYFSAKTLFYNPNKISKYAFKIDDKSKISTIAFSGYIGIPVRPVHEKPDASSLNYVEKENANTVYKTFENGQIVIVKNGVKFNLAGQRL